MLNRGTFMPKKFRKAPKTYANLNKHSVNLKNPISNNSNNIPEYSAIRKIKTMTFQGGGVKGTAYAGVAEELEKTGVLAQLEEVAGASAGSIFAMLLAIGYTAEELKVEMSNLNFKDFEDAGMPGWIESLHLGDVLDPMIAMSSISNKIDVLNNLPGVKAMGSELAQNIAGALPETVIQQGNDLAKGLNAVANPAAKIRAIYTALNKAEKGLHYAYHLGMYEGDILKNWLANIVARKTGNPNITFQELATLAKDPTTRFKKLTVTGSNLTDRKREYFNAENTPDMSIIDAVRISSSFPGAFQPVIQTDKNGKKAMYVDGGLLENLPDAFNNPPYNPKENFAVVFRDPDELKSHPIEGPFSALKMGKAIFKSVFSDEKNYQKYQGRIAYIDPVGMDTLEFDAPPEKKAAIIRSGQAAVKDAFAGLLNQEKTSDNLFETQDAKELIRLKIGLSREIAKLKDGLEKRALLKQREAINHKIKNLNLSDTELKRLESLENARLAIIEKRKNVSSLSDRELMKICKDNRDVLVRAQHELINNAKLLRTARVGVHMKKMEILRASGSGKNKTEKVTKLDQELEKIDNSLKEIKIHSEQNRREIQNFNEYEKHFEKRHTKANTFDTLFQFKKDFDKSMVRNTRFLSRLKKTLLSFAPNSRLWKGTLDFVLGAAGIAAFVCCLCPPVLLAANYITPGLIASNTVLGLKSVPFLGLPIAILMEKIGPKSFKETAQRFINWFKWYDVDYHTKMLDFQEMTAELVRVMRSNRAEDKSKLSYLKVFYLDFLKNSGLKFQDLLEKKPNESILDYQERIHKVEKRLTEALAEPEQAGRKLEHPEKAKETQRMQAKFGEFQQQIYERNLKRLQKIEQKIKQNSPITKREERDYNAFKTEMMAAEQTKEKKSGKRKFKPTVWSRPLPKEEATPLLTKDSHRHKKTK